MEILRVSKLGMALVTVVMGIGLQLPAPTLLAGKTLPRGVGKKAAVGKFRNAPERLVVRASWYGEKFHGRPAANGKSFDASAHTAAHRSFQLGTKLEVTNPRNGKKVIVEVTDRGPFVPGRDLDLSYGAARELGIVRAGVAKVHIRVIDAADLAAGEPIVIASTAEGSAGAWPRAIVR
ncbi:MAG: hypothetical protein KatS3mg077_3083 [Candidatus Binatia bacterium]|nr:MAG: hypothetical protein KatS3mg077_3083 [Candidatus Binatia bacterium]